MLDSRTMPCQANDNDPRERPMSPLGAFIFGMARDFNTIYDAERRAEMTRNPFSSELLEALAANEPEIKNDIS